MDDIKNLMKRCLRTACNAVTDAHLEAIGEDREMSLAEWEKIMVDTLIANGVTIPVRCKDCIHFNPEKALRPGGIWCEYWGTDPDPEDWCCKGERRTDD